MRKILFLLISCYMLGTVNAVTTLNSAGITDKSIKFYIENDSNEDFSKILIQSTKGGKSIYHEGFSCKAKSKCTLEIKPDPVIEKSITMVFSKNNGRIASAYILARPRMGQENLVKPSDEYLGKYVFKQIKRKVKNVQKDDVYNKLKELSGNDTSYQDKHKDVYDALAFAVKDKLTNEELGRESFSNQFATANSYKASE